MGEGEWVGGRTVMPVAKPEMMFEMKISHGTDARPHEAEASRFCCERSGAALTLTTIDVATASLLIRPSLSAPKPKTAQTRIQCSTTDAQSLGKSKNTFADRSVAHRSGARGNVR